MSDLTIAGPVLLGLALLIAFLLIVTVVMAVRAASGRKRARKAEHGESAMLSMALQDAVTKLKAQERQMAARRAASSVSTERRPPVRWPSCCSRCRPWRA
jgi:hypothetical protein